MNKRNAFHVLAAAVLAAASTALAAPPPQQGHQEEGVGPVEEEVHGVEDGGMVPALDPAQHLPQRKGQRPVVADDLGRAPYLEEAAALEPAKVH